MAWGVNDPPRKKTFEPTFAGPTNKPSNSLIGARALAAKLDLSLTQMLANPTAEVREFLQTVTKSGDMLAITQAADADKT